MLEKVEIEVVYLGARDIEFVKPYGYRALRGQGVWACDEWHVTLAYEGRAYSTSYKTGIGHRRKALYEAENYYADASTAKKGIAAKDVLECLFLDAGGAYDTFESWCIDSGHDTDSRKALDTYLACQSTATALRKLFGADYSAIEKEVHNDEG